MNKAQLIKIIAEKADITKKAAEQALESILENIIKTMKKGEEVSLTGFGTFSAKVRHARVGVNPQNPQERIQMPEVVVPKFKAGKTLKDALKK